MSRALQINSSPQGWMARNTKPVPLAEKGWVITMKKISIILLSAVLVFSMAACNGGKEKADNQTEKQTESVKPTEEAMATEAVTEVTTEAGSEETDKDIAEVKDSEEKTDKEDNQSADNETASKQKEKSEQNDEPEQKAPASGNKEAGGNQSNAGNGGQTTDSPKDNVSNPQPASVAYSPQNVVSLATAKCQAGGMITTQQNLQNHLNDGSITQEEYNEYYPYDGMEGSYYSVFVETDLNKATLPSFASRRTSEAPTYELKWNEGSQRFETTLSDSNGVLSDFDFGISGYSVDKNGNSITISSTSVNTTATTGTFTSNAGKVETTSSCVFWLTGKSGCTNRVQTMTTDGNGYAKSAALVAGTYYVKEITAPKGYVLSGKVHTLTVKAGQTTGISATDKEQLGAITIYKEGEVLSSWNGSNFTYEKKKLSGAAFKVTAGADIYKADGTKVYNAGDVVAESLTTGTDGQVVLSDLHLGTYVVTEIKSIDGYTINTTPQTVAVEYKDQTVTVQYESTTIENTRQKADVSVVKKDSDTENPLDGGKYTLYAGNDIKNYAGQVIVTKGTALETVTTGEDGKASYSVDLPISNGYYIQETQAPYAYIRNSKDVYSFNFNVLPETQAKASFSHTFVNDRTTAKIHIYKVDKESGKAAAQGDASLEGAVYGLYARNDIVHPDGATGVVFKAGDLVATLTTDKNGEAEVNNLYLGNYYVKEITPSEGYLLDEEEHDVVCDYEGDLVAEVSRSTTSAEQVIKQPFQLIKVSDNGDDTEAGLLAGAEFTAYLKSSLSVKADGSYDFDKATPVVIGENGATTITSDDKGHAVSIAIPYGTYVVVESKTPHNMKTIKPFEVKIKENHPTEPQTWRVFLDREFTAKLRVIKKDSDTKQTVLVPNAEFKIFNIDKNEYVTQYTTYPSKVKHTSFFTDEDGDLILPEALKIGNYRIEEVKAPFGYVVNDNYINISVDTDTAFLLIFIRKQRLNV